MGIRGIAWGLALVLLTAVSATAAQVDNGGFEAGLDGWHWAIAHGADAQAEVVSDVYHGGHHSLKLSSRTDLKPNVFGGCRQPLKGLEAMTHYRVTLWARGRNVGHDWFGGGPGWHVRQYFPRGSFDWRKFYVEFDTGLGQHAFEFRLNVDSTTTALWIDDIQITAEGSASVSVGRPHTQAGIPAAAAFYPALPVGEGIASPIIHLQDGKDQQFGADLAIRWDAQSLVLDVTVRDPTKDQAVPGSGMWHTDSVQVGIDTRPAPDHHSYGDTCYELGIAPGANGALLRYCWHGGVSADDLAAIRGQSVRDKDGYVLHARIPWTTLGLSDGAPKSLAMNVLVNDGQGGKRRYVQWTPGIGQHKDPAAFARIALMNNPTPVGVLRVARDKLPLAKGILQGEITRYGFGGLPAKRLTLHAVGSRGSRSELVNVKLPAIKGGMSQTVRFAIQARSKLTADTYELHASLGKDGPTIAPAAVEVIDYQSNISGRLKAVAAQYQTLRDRMTKHSALQGDAYVKMGLKVAARFMDRVRKGREAAAWSVMQLEEVQSVLERAQARAQALEAGEVKPYVLRRPTPPIIARDGLLWSGERGEKRPVFLYGYGHFNQIRKDLPNFHALGVTLVQQERGPSSMTPDGALTAGGRSIVDELSEADRAGIMMDLLLSPHYFPKWAVKKAPDVMLTQRNWNFIKFDIDHPEARSVIHDWLDAIIPAVKESPALASVCLANEPAYFMSGVDRYSRGDWTAYLKEIHPELDQLNALYRTHYKAFDDVPVPDATMPTKVEARRAYYDWCRFNQRHFTRWMRWMNERVKAQAPKLLTHIKIMESCFSGHRVDEGIDPELICGITDLAGNDCAAYPTPQGKWAYQWRREEMWYDLLHSFDGQPVFNSENHLIENHLPARHILPAATRAVLWQGALHHLAATTIWVWQETGAGSAGDLSGSVYFRPANIAAAGRAMLDANRLAQALGRINGSAARVAILYSFASHFWNADYYSTAADAYAALTFTGHPVTFVSERQLAEGKRSSANEKVKWIILPGATHVTDGAVKGLARFVKEGGHVLEIGTGNLVYDEYHRHRSLPAGLENTLRVSDAEDDEALAGSLVKALESGGLTVPRLHGSDTHGRRVGEKVPAPSSLRSSGAAWGVEYRVVKTDQGVLVPMVNFAREDKTVALKLRGDCRDLISGERVDPEHITLESVRPRLLLFSGG